MICSWKYNIFANVVFTYFALTNLNLHTKSCEVYSSRTTKDQALLLCNFLDQWITCGVIVFLDYEKSFIIIIFSGFFPRCVFIDFERTCRDLEQFFSTNTDSALFLTPLHHAPHCEDYEVCTLLSKILKYRRSRNYNLFSAVTCCVLCVLDC